MATPYLVPDDLRSVRGLESSDAYPDDVLASYVAEFEGIAEMYRGVAFTPRTAVETVSGAGAPVSLFTVLLSWPKVRAVTSVALDGDAVDTDLYRLTDLGAVYASAGLYGTTVVVTYSHGYDLPSTGWLGAENLLNACKQYVRSCAKRDESGVARDTLSIATGDGGTIRYSTPDPAAGRPTGYLDVDRLLNLLPDYRHPGIG